jgi:hypothetical protein
MHPVKELPAGYRQLAALDLSRDRRLQVLLTVAGVPAFILFAAPFTLATAALRSGAGSGAEIELSGIELLLGLVVLLGTIALVMVLHELVHGLCYWLFTGERPYFGFKGLYAYAAAPSWYIPRGRFLVVGGAPLVALSLAGLVAMPFVPAVAVAPLLIALICNAAGAMGDLYAIIWLFRWPSAALAHDTGDGITLYAPERA